MNETFQAREFVETPEGLFFAVVSNGVVQDRVLCFLRYRYDGQQFQKLTTHAAHSLLRSRFPHYLCDMRQLAAPIHTVPVDRIRRHFTPRRRAAEILASGAANDSLIITAGRFMRQLMAHGLPAQDIGITGSLLIGAHTDQSDIDVVIYGREQFHQARAIVQQLTINRDVEPLSGTQWHTTYLRRGCSLSFEDYLWHEQRKFNKLCLDEVKIDISMNCQEQFDSPESIRKIQRVDFTAAILDDQFGFDQPAIWEIDSDVATRLVSWTPTYVGQAFRHETVRIRGWLEELADASRQVVVGSSREAAGESIAVVNR